jgi:hypothetical protein
MPDGAAGPIQMEPPSSILGMGVLLHTSLHRPGRSRACDPGETSGDNDWNFECAERGG